MKINLFSTVLQLWSCCWSQSNDA